MSKTDNRSNGVIANGGPNNADIDYSKIVASVRKAFNSGKSKDVDFRIRQLESLRRMLDENVEVFIDALQKY